MRPAAAGPRSGAAIKRFCPYQENMAVAVTILTSNIDIHLLEPSYC